MDTGATGVGRIAPEKSSAITQRMAMLSITVALVLVAMKGATWIFSGSVAILSSLADSMLDLAASLFSYFAVRYAATPPDREHRFGHGKAEAFAGLFQAGLVAVSGALIGVEAVVRLLAPRPLSHAGEAIGVMLASIVLTAGLIYAQSRALAQTGSVATKGDRAHYASDLGANVVVIAGIAASAVAPWADSVAGILIALWLGHGAWEVARDSANHLMDKELAEDARMQIVELAREGGEILGVHDLRTRASGPFVHIQFHADMDPEMPLRNVHAVIVAAEQRILKAFPAADVIIHPDPVDGAEPHGHEYFAEGRKAAE